MLLPGAVDLPLVDAFQPYCLAIGMIAIAMFVRSITQVHIHENIIKNVTSAEHTSIANQSIKRT